MSRGSDGSATILRPDGIRVDVAPPLPPWTEPFGDALRPTTTRLANAGIAIGPQTPMSHWDGERVDVGWAIDVLRQRADPAVQSFDAIDDGVLHQPKDAVEMSLASDLLQD